MFGGRRETNVIGPLSAKELRAEVLVKLETGNWKLENSAASFQFLTSNFCFLVSPQMHAFASMSRNHAAQTLTQRTVVVIHLIRRRRHATEPTDLGTFPIGSDEGRAARTH
jgi:hypothetical protein